MMLPNRRSGNRNCSGVACGVYVCCSGFIEVILGVEISVLIFVLGPVVTVR
jgi:hypothetical protein